MSTMPLHTPVAFFVFNRPETTRTVFGAIARMRPTKLLLVADGPRLDREGEAEASRKVRRLSGALIGLAKFSGIFPRIILAARSG